MMKNKGMYKLFMKKLLTLESNTRENLPVTTDGNGTRTTWIVQTHVLGTRQFTFLHKKNLFVSHSSI